MKNAWLLILLVLFQACSASNTSNHVCNEEGKNSTIKITTSPTNNPPQVKGVIKDRTNNEVMSFVTVVFTDSSGQNFGCSTDMDGRFDLKKLLPGHYELKIQATGYPTTIRHIDIVNGKDYFLEISLESEPIMLEKPVIYLYPERTTDITVQLDYKGNLSHSYPSYTSGGWQVTAKPDGTLFDTKGKEYYALFWEGVPEKNLTAPNGFIVAGKDVATFLDEKLEYLGLNRREANEFIMHWLPRMENNPYNLIHFSSDDYEALAQLKINPRPETLIRVMMVFKPLNEKIEFPVQDLSPLHKTRSGFTVVEWGGSELKEISI